MASSLKEHRSFPRIELHTPLRYQIRGQPQFDNATSFDISSGGMCFTSNNFIPPETALMLEIKVLSCFFKAIGKVVWAQTLPHSYRNHIGVQFIEVDPEEKKCLEDFINMKTKNNSHKERNYHQQ